MALFKNIYHFFLAWLGGLIYGQPSREVFVLGVTGTKGKSTVLELINEVLEAAGKKTALTSSVRIKIGSESRKNLTENTMPGRFFLQKFLRDAVTHGCEYVLIEVTSEGIVQCRHRFIDFDAALFLNLHPEHIERHGSFEKYRAAKVKFFEDVAKFSPKVRRLFFINHEDRNHGYFVDAVRGRGEIYYFSKDDFLGKKLGGRRNALGDWLSSDFNMENAAAAARFAELHGINWDTIKKALSSYKGLEGRMDVAQEKPFRVVVDYAHTPDSLLKVYKALSNSKLKNKNQKPKLICVLGSAGGGRDKWKRPEFGKIAGEYCDTIILTNEDPYDEEPNSILDQVKSGIRSSAFDSGKSGLYEILDRREAVNKAITLAKKNDTIIITGKGSENWIHVANGKKIPWNERKIVEELLG